MSVVVTLGGVPTEDVELGYTLPGQFHSHGQEWQSSADGVVWTTVGVGSTFTPGDAEAGKSLRVVVQAADNDTDAETEAASAPETVVNLDDEPQGTLTINGEAVQGATLTLAEAIADADGIADPDRGYEWQVQGENGDWSTVPGGWGPSFTLTQAEVGRVVRAVMSYVDDHGNREWVVTGPTPAVANANDAPAGALAITGEARQGETLEVADGVTDADGVPAGARAYHWHVEGDGGGWIDIPGATGAAYTLTEAEVGRVVQAVLIYTDAHGTVERVETAATFAVQNANDAPGGALGVGGEAKQGGVLTLTNGVTDADGFQPEHLSYSWEAQGANGAWTYIPGAFALTFALTEAEVGRSVRAVFSYIDGHGRHERVESAPTAPVENANDSPGGTLAIVGAARQGEALSLADAVTDADGMVGAVREYQWQVEGEDGDWTDIAGATGATFTPTQAEVGRSVRGVMAYQDDRGQWETPVTEGTAAVGNANDAPAGLPAIAAGAPPQEDVPLTVDISAVADPDGLGAFRFHWSRDDGTGHFTSIDGATGATYTPGDADVGARLGVWAEYTDGWGTIEGFWLSTTAAALNANDVPTGAVTLGGHAVRGGTIAASTSSLADADGMGAVSLRWERGDGNAWAPIAGATGPSYAPGAADVGRVLRAVATWTDGHGTAEATAAETGVVAPRAIALPPPESGEDERDSAADEWTSADLGAMVADGGVFVPPAGAESVRLADGVLSFGTGTAEAFVARLYLGLLGREGDAEGLARAVRAVEDGASRADLARAFLSSAEHGARRGERTDAEFVEDLYDAFLGRSGGADERGFWTAALDGGLSRAEAAAAIAGSPEAADHMRASTTGVFVADVEAIHARSLYRCALGREADAPGLRHWSTLLDLGADPRTFGDGFEEAAEFAARHGGGTDEAFVRSLYQTGLSRQADAEGLGHWVGLLEAGATGRGELALRFSMTQEARSALDWSL